MTSSPKFETKADPLEESFDAVLMAEDVAHQSDEIKSLRTDVDGLKTQMTDISKASARPALDGAKGMLSSTVAQDFVARYLRRGDQAGIELKSFSSASGPEGGFAVPQEIDGLIGATLRDISPIRAIATVVQTGSAGYRKLVTTGGTPSGWVSETAGRPETDTPDFNEIAPPTGELYANPAASQMMLDDAAFDVEAWLADEIAREFAQAEGAAFVSGSGVNQPRGFLNAAVTDENDDVRAFGALQYVASGASGSFASEDALVDLVHTLRPAYRQGASFVMNSATLARIRKFKTADGAFLWQPSLAQGQPATLLGYPVVEAEDMPDIAADSLSIAFGNFRAGYLIAERSATRILRDPFTNKPFVHFYATKRVGGQLMNSEAIKLMQFSAS
ncbi:phage major capsid protein [Parasphingorhabdus sp.]|jgi:HK97 family phage major capsid protein|uniref:phage major capsid protein n=1 Tax=Parasphingorhabdus sp. TaxID=2709688 RepID=UPI003D29C40F